MRSTIGLILFVMLFSASPTHADLLDCIDPDVKQTLLQSVYSPPPTITREIPDSFPDFTHPEGFAFIGSSATNNSVSIAFKTSFPPVKAEGEMAEALEDSGFERQIKHNRPSQGFQTRANRPMFLTFCGNDSQPSIHVITRRSDDKTYMRLTTSKIMPGSGQLGCREAQDHMSRMANRFMPDLSLPPERTQGISSSGGGGNDNATTKIRFTAEYSMAELLSFINQQLADQNWQHGGDWVSSIGEGSVWSTKRDSVRLSGNLQVVSHTQSEYSATFTIWQFD